MNNKCKHCNSEITHSKHNKYCGIKCFNKYKKSLNQWFKCSCCMAKIGLSSNQVSKIFKVHKGTVCNVWKREGIKATTPNGVSLKNQIIQNNNKDNRMMALYHKSWMKEIKKANSAGFEWSKIWYNEKARINTLGIYHSLSDNEKRDLNKKTSDRKRDKMDTDESYRQTILMRSSNFKKNNRPKINDYMRQYMKRRKKEDPSFRSVLNMRDRFKDLMNTTKKGGAMSFSKTIGCSTRQLSNHLQSKFTKDMSWDNYGSHWHVDHILPCAAFDHSDENQVRQCWHYTNLQPLEAHKNIIKSDSITNPQMSLLLNYA